MRWTVLALLLAMITVPARAQRPRTQWDRVYTPWQASRGETTYGQQCASCHGVELSGSEMGPELRGKAFDERWDAKPLEAQFGRMKATMPASAPGSLSSRLYADVLAFMLSKASFPAGDVELPADADVLSRITYVMARP